MPVRVSGLNREEWEEVGHRMGWLPKSETAADAPACAHQWQETRYYVMENVGKSMHGPQLQECRLCGVLRIAKG